MESLYHAADALDIKRELTDAYAVPLERAYKYYLTVGGMPEAVNKWVNTHDLVQTEEIQDNILADYAGDFAKHAPLADVPKLGWIWDSVPIQLAKENFVLTELLNLGITPFFWRSGNTAELDFLFEHEGEIIPVEAKAALHTRAKSYRQFCRKYSPKTGFRFSLKNIGDNYTGETCTYSLPLYMVWKLKHYLG